MKGLFMFGPVLLALIGSGCATRGYARRQVAPVNDRVGQVQTQHQTDVSRIDERITTTDKQVQQANANAAQANANAAQANASVAQASASAAQASASAAQANTSALQARQR